MQPRRVQLVERALHPAVLEEIADELGTDWRNHEAERAGIAYADRTVARDVSLDLSTRFRDLIFPDNAEKVATRLGAQDLLVDFGAPFDGPFGDAVARLSIPQWMAGGVGRDEQPELLDRDDAGQRFRLGERRYVYGRWGLASTD